MWRENVFEPPRRRRDDVDFVVGDLGFALAPSLAPRSAAAEHEKCILRCDVARESEEE